MSITNRNDGQNYKNKTQVVKNQNYPLKMSIAVCVLTVKVVKNAFLSGSQHVSTTALAAVVAELD